MNHVDKKRGFTLIELMLAMSFISVLLIAIAMTIIQIGNIYNRGLMLKEVDQTGQAVATELQNAIRQSAPFSIATGSGSHYVPQAWGGRLCIGQYSYIWNYGKDLNAKNPNVNKYAGLDSSTDIHLVKVLDPGALYCLQKPLLAIDATKATELLATGDYQLAIHSFTIKSNTTAIDTKTRQQLYDIQLSLGTNDKNALTYGTDGSATCTAPGQDGADLTYCSVSVFDIVARAGNTVQ